MCVCMRRFCVVMVCVQGQQPHSFSPCVFQRLLHWVVSAVLQVEQRHALVPMELQLYSLTLTSLKGVRATSVAQLQVEQSYALVPMEQQFAAIYNVLRRHAEETPDHKVTSG